MKNELLEEIRDYIKDRYYTVVDEVEIDENLYLTIYCEEDSVLVNYKDFNNKCECGGVFQREMFLEMTNEDMERTLNHSYYYNCNIPMKVGEEQDAD